MKFVTTNFVTCPVKSCRSSMSSFPLKFSESKLVQKEFEYDQKFLLHLLKKLDWSAIHKVAVDLGNTEIPEFLPVLDENLDNSTFLKCLHTLLLETEITEAKMVCQSCQNVFYVKNSIPFFLLPPHLC